MKSIIILVLLNIFLNKHVYSCTETDTNCNSTEVNISVAMIENVSFVSIQNMNFGQVSKGEFVTVTTESNQTRGRSSGIVNIISDYNSAGIVVSCVHSSSYITFGNDDTFFNNCNLLEEGTAGSSPSSTITLDQTTSSNQTHSIRIGGSIQIPNLINTQGSNVTGVVRIEVQLL